MMIPHFADWQVAFLNHISKYDPVACAGTLHTGIQQKRLDISGTSHESIVSGPPPILACFVGCRSVFRTR